MIHLGRDMTKRLPVSLFDMADVLMVYSPALISTKAGWCDFSISENIQPFCRLLQKRFLCNHDNLFKSKKEMRREQDGELTRKMKNSNGERVSWNDQEPFHARCNESQRFVSIYSPSLFILYPLICTLMLMLHIPEYIFRRKEKKWTKHYRKIALWLPSFQRKYHFTHICIDIVLKACTSVPEL